MKNISLPVFFGLLLLLSFNTTAVAGNITISGSARFECNLLMKYMGKHGYSFIKENKDINNNFKANLFAARDADVIVKDQDNNIVGTGKTDKKGNFSISAPEEKK